MVGLNKAFTEGTKMEELITSKTSPMANDLTSKATGGSLYTIKPIMSSADRYREARLKGETMKPATNDMGGSSASIGVENSSASLFPLVGIIAFGAAAAIAIMEYPEHKSDIAQYLSNSKSLAFLTSTSDWVPGLDRENAEIMDRSLAKQPVWLQRQR